MTDLFSSEVDPASITFDQLVGEGKKYRDQDAAAKAIVEKDNFIEKLKSEAELARQELRSRTNLEELVAKLQRPQEPNREITPTPRQEPIQGNEPTPVDLKAEVAKLLEEERNKTSRENNLNTARQGLKERFGADYNQTLKNIAVELGVTEKFIIDMASTSPTGFFKLVDSVKTPDSKVPVTPPNSRDHNPAPSASGRKNKAYFDALRKADINAYLSPKVQNEYHREAMAQGDRFYE